MKTDDWKPRAEALFFVEGKNIKQVSSLIGVSVRSISAHLNSLPSYDAERLRRKELNKNRTEYYREHKKGSRSKINYNVCGETMKIEHKKAVDILSRERFFNE